MGACLARASKKQAGNGLLYVLMSMDLWCDAPGIHLFVDVWIGCKLLELGLLISPAGIEQSFENWRSPGMMMADAYLMMCCAGTKHCKGKCHAAESRGPQSSIRWKAQASLPQNFISFRAVDGQFIEDVPGGLLQHMEAWTFHHRTNSSQQVQATSGPKRLIINLTAADRLEARSSPRADESCWDDCRLHVNALGHHVT